jgi:hypothetical protein
MRGARLIRSLAWFVLSCSSSDDGSGVAAPSPMSTVPVAPAQQAPGAASPEASAPATDEAAPGPAEDADETTVEALTPGVVAFRDPGSSFVTTDVYDATREIVRFDAERQAMVSAATGDSVSGWMTDGNDLGPFGSFRVRFGTEGGERRAYFTETGNGTICNIVLSGPEMLSIFGTSERPPME